MAQLIQDLFGVLGLDMSCPTNLAEFFPWFFTVLFCAGFVGTFLKWLQLLVSGAGRAIR